MDWLFRLLGFSHEKCDDVPEIACPNCSHSSHLHFGCEGIDDPLPYMCWKVCWVEEKGMKRQRRCECDFSYQEMQESMKEETRGCSP